MARIPNSVRTTVMKANAYIERKVHETNAALKDSEDLVQRITEEGNFTPTNITRLTVLPLDLLMVVDEYLLL